MSYRLEYRGGTRQIYREGEYYPLIEWGTCAYRYKTWPPNNWKVFSDHCYSGHGSEINRQQFIINYLSEIDFEFFIWLQTNSL